MYSMTAGAPQLQNIIPYLVSVLDVLNDGVYISDQHGETLLVNAMYERLTGLRAAELVGKNVHDLLQDGIFDTILNPQIVGDKKTHTSVQQVRNGKKVVLRGTPVLDEHDNVVLVVTFVRDVTMITQLREQVAEQRELIDRYHDSIEYITSEHNKVDGNVFHSQQMREVIALLKRFAATDATMLLLGETGVGKGILAHMAHSNSPRKEEMFLKVDCGSIPENLIESELFGYVPGAFSGASPKGKIGYFEMADKGTIFLDEIGELPLPMQAKLLRVLQDQEVLRVGSSTVKKVDVRIIAATNKNLEEEVAKGTFRSDLYYRLRVAVITIPPLRARDGDIAPLVEHFLNRYSVKFRKPTMCSSATMALLEAYNWPGNVREVQNQIQSLVITCEDGVIEPVDLPSNILGGKTPVPRYVPPDIENRSLKEIMADVERDIIQKALDTHGSVSKVAKMFKVNRTTIFRKLNKNTTKELPAETS